MSSTNKGICYWKEDTGKEEYKLDKGNQFLKGLLPHPQIKKYQNVTAKQSWKQVFQIKGGDRTVLHQRKSEEYPDNYSKKTKKQKKINKQHTSQSSFSWACLGHPFKMGKDPTEAPPALYWHGIQETKPPRYHYKVCSRSLQKTSPLFTLLSYS